MGGESVAEVGEGELESIGEAFRVGDGGGEVGEEGCHVFGGHEVPAIVDGEEGAGLVEVRVVSEAGEDVEGGAGGGCGVEDAVGGEEREGAGAGEVDEGAVDAILTATAMALDLDEDVVGAESRLEALDDFGGWNGTAGQGATERTFLVAGEGDEPFGVGREFGPEDPAFALGGAEVGGGEEVAEVLVSSPGGDEDGEDGFIVEDEFRADDGSDAGFAGDAGEAGGAVDSHAVAEGDGREAEAGGGVGEGLGKGGGAQEAEGAAGVEFDVGPGAQELEGDRWGGGQSFKGQDGSGAARRSLAPPFGGWDSGEIPV